MASKTQNLESEQKPRCGIIMPISEIDGRSLEHWVQVKNLLLEVISQTEFEGDLVSNANEVMVIHETIVQNIYSNEMIICDVSGKNPNVMFELGLRIAFDKPAVIIKDDDTNYSFDTGPILHLEYPRDMNYSKIIEFKILLKETLIATFEKSKDKGDYSPFLKSFGQFKVAEIETKEIPGQDFIIKELEEIKKSIWNLTDMRNTSLETTLTPSKHSNSSIKGFNVVIDSFKTGDQLLIRLYDHLPNNGIEFVDHNYSNNNILREITLDNTVTLEQISPIFRKLQEEIPGIENVTYNRSK